MFLQDVQHLIIAICKCKGPVKAACMPSDRKDKNNYCSSKDVWHISEPDADEATPPQACTTSARHKMHTRKFHAHTRIL